MNDKEANSRIKINKLLEESGWRFEDNEDGPANIQLEAGVKFETLGEDFEFAETHDKRGGAIDFLLLDVDGRPLVVVEAKREAIDPLSAKEQARNYAHTIGSRFVILSNGNLHYFWDTKHGVPETIVQFPNQISLTQFETYVPNHEELASTPVDENYVIATQLPEYDQDSEFQDDSKRDDFLYRKNLKQLRPYQVQAIKALQASAKEGNNRFLFEMATGTGKTLTSAAVIKLFLKSGNAKRVLFLVDRLELEDQTEKAFSQYLGSDYRCVIYKEHPEDWRSAAVVVSTIQTFMAGDRYRKEFSPTDFEFVISDEAHRSIGGNSRAVFEYFVGYKLGLTATPKNYLKGLDDKNPDTQREFERRVLHDTYKTFGCEPGRPTYTYDLVKGSKEGYLIQPTLVDARTEITTELLSKEGYAVHVTTDEGEEVDETYKAKDFERKFFNEETNISMCKALLDNGHYDPIADQLGVKLFGKSIVFCVSQKHAVRVTNILNKLAFEKWPESYGEADFAMQVTSHVRDAQQMTINFANNRLGGVSRNPEGYETSKSRVAVTVGMMTTGYDCQDLLNIALMRPVFSPSDFVQIKGRGTRKNRFEYTDFDTNETTTINKESFKFFDFFATCEYFENEYPYDEKIKLPKISKTESLEGGEGSSTGEFVDEEGKKVFSGPVDLASPDDLASVTETQVGDQGMRIDREGFKQAIEEDILGNETLMALWENGDRQEAEEYTKTHVFGKPKHFLDLGTIRKIFGIDRRVTVREFLEFAFGDRHEFEMKDDLLEKEWEKFLEVHPVDQEHYWPAKNFFKAYITDEDVRDIIKRDQPADFHFSPTFDFSDYEKLNGYRDLVPQYVHDYAYHLTNL